MPVCAVTECILNLSKIYLLLESLLVLSEKLLALDKLPLQHYAKLHSTPLAHGHTFKYRNISISTHQNIWSAISHWSQKYLLQIVTLLSLYLLPCVSLVSLTWSSLQVLVPASTDPVQVAIEGVQGPKVTGMIGVDDITVFSSSQCSGESNEN